MKRLILLTAIVPLLLTSCSRDPYADFTVSKDIAMVGEIVNFTNRSVDAIDYEWDFDDGNFSVNTHASHAWTSPGIYDVSLSAFGKNGDIDIAFWPVEIIQDYCDLEVYVEEYEEPYYYVTDISVRLYPTITDWENETNMIVEGFTGSNGKVLFLDVPIPYNKRVYVDVWGPNHDNYLLAEEDAGWIETDILVKNVRNYFTAVVDYYPDGKKSGVSRKDMKIQRKKEAEGKTKRLSIERENISRGAPQAR